MKSNILLFLILFIFSAAVVCAESGLPWDWQPSWYDKGDCGPNALYVLMNLCGNPITNEKVKTHLAFDSVKGCTLEDMQQAAAKLGFPLEARFVKPSDISKVPRPFIIHGITSQEQQLGHFVVVVDFEPDKKVYKLIDPVRETFTRNPEESLLHNFSGYVLVPVYQPIRFWNYRSGVVLVIAAVLLLVIPLMRKLRQTRHVTHCCLLCVCGLFLGCHSQNQANEPPARKAARGEKIPFIIKAREVPIRIEPVGGLEHVVTEEQMAAALSASLPLWHPPSVPSLVHELKLWGRDCDFPAEIVGGKGRTGQMMVETLLSDKLCAENTVVLGSGKGGSYLIDSPFGIHAIQSGSYDAVEYRAETHYGK